MKMCVCRRLLPVLVLGITLLAPFSTLRSQESAFEARRQQQAVTPGRAESLMILDGELYCQAAGVILKTLRNGSEIKGLEIDTVFARIDDAMEYAVRNPLDGKLYYTKRDRDGRSQLYEYQERPGKKGKTRRVKMDDMTVEHPVFTADGHLMIFSSNELKRCYGGYDLWYSTLESDGTWARPINLGKRVNTMGDEIFPTLYADFLLFASTGHGDDVNHLSLYATRLIASRIESDTVGMLMIGRSKVQRLPAPLNVAGADDYAICIDSVRGCGYWLSTRGNTTAPIHAFGGTLDGVLLWGRTTTADGSALAGASVVARQGNHQVCATVSDEDGFYRLYLRSDQKYDIDYRLDNYFAETLPVTTRKSDTEYLIAEMRQDATLNRLPYDEPIYFDDLFGPDADLQLSVHGKEVLAPLVRFLNDNPHTSAEVRLSNCPTNDDSFNGILATERTKTIKDYLINLLPPTVKISYSEGVSQPCSHTTAIGNSRLTVLIHNGL